MCNRKSTIDEEEERRIRITNKLIDDAENAIATTNLQPVLQPILDLLKDYKGMFYISFLTLIFAKVTKQYYM